MKRLFINYTATLFAITLLIVGISSCSLVQTIGGKTSSITLGFYNVENLFDTIDNPHTHDNEFMPDGKKQWNTERLYAKMQKLDSVVSVMTINGAPDILGVCEVENKQVCTEWQHRGVLKNHVLIHRESPDHRGIDVGLFYNPAKMTLENARWYQVLQEGQGGQKKSSTREILYAKLIKGKDSLHVFVNHWPSRYGGEEKSRPKRMKAAQVLRNVIDSVFAVDAFAKITIVGDFNDYPTNASICEGLKADSLLNGKSDLFNLSYQTEKQGLGSYNYRGDWGCLDQIIVSKAFVNAKKGFKAPVNGYTIIKEEFMLYYNKKGEASPSRTYGGPNYYGGFSDHLPVVVEFKN